MPYFAPENKTVPSYITFLLVAAIKNNMFNH